MSDDEHFPPAVAVRELELAIKKVERMGFYGGKQKQKELREMFERAMPKTLKQREKEREMIVAKRKRKRVKS